MGKLLHKMHHALNNLVCKKCIQMMNLNNTQNREDYILT